MADKQLKLNVNTPAVATDGTNIIIDEKGNVTVLFFQIVNRGEDEVTANAVAHVRLSLEQLEQFKGLIDNAVKGHNKALKEREAKKSE